MSSISLTQTTEHGDTVTYPGNGANFPQGYQPNWDQSKPFRCPIVNCHLSFEFGRDTHLIQRQTRYEFVNPLFIGQLSL